MPTLSDVIEGLRPHAAPGPIPLSVEALAALAAEGPCACGGLGYVRFDLPREHPAFGRAFVCACRAGSVQQTRIERLFANAGIPDRYRGLGFDTWARLSAAQRRGKGEALALAKAFADVERFKARGGVERADGVKPGLILWGPVGAGKTGLAVAAFRAWLAAGQAGLWITWHELIRTVQSAYSGESSADPQRYLDEAARAPLLVLDDLGDAVRGGGPDSARFATTDDRRDITYDVVNYRHARSLPTLITTNLAPHERRAQFGARVDDRLVELCHSIAVGGANLRA